MAFIEYFLAAILLTSASSHSFSDQTPFEILASFYQNPHTKPHILKFFTDIKSTPTHPYPSIESIISSYLQFAIHPKSDPFRPQPPKDVINLENDLNYSNDVDDPDIYDDPNNSGIQYSSATLGDVVDLNIFANVDDSDNLKVGKITLPPDVSIPPAIQELPLDCKLCLGVSFGLHRGISKTNYTFVENLVVKLCAKLLKPLGFNTDDLCQSTVTLYGPYVDQLLKDTRIPKLKNLCQYFNACLDPRPGKPIRNNNNKNDNNNNKNENNNKNNTNKNKSGRLRSYSSIGEVNGEESEENDKKIHIIKNNNNNIHTKNDENNNDNINKKKNKEEEIIRIIQVNDLHLESQYAPNSSVLCGLPACCLKEHGKGGSGTMGDYRCDSSTGLIEGFIQKMSLLKPDVVILNGGVTSDKFWDQTLASQLEATSAVEKLFAQKLNRVYPTFAASDSFPSHIFSKSTAPANGNDTDKFLDYFYKTWEKLAGFEEDDKTSILKTGSYSKLLFPGLRGIFFNSAYMYTFNVLNRLNHEKLRNPEVKESKKFLEDALKNAKEANESVILSLHHAMGTSDFINSESSWLHEVLLQYSQSLVLVINGHTHFNEFRVLYDDKGQPKVVTLVAPSVSSNNHRNPGLRLYKINKKTFQLLDYQQYFLDLAKFKNVDSSKVAESIVQLYSAKQEYQLPDLSPSSWHNLINKLESNPDLLLKHLNHYSNEARKLTSVGPLQRHRHLCRLESAKYELFKECNGSFEVPSPTIRPNSISTTTAPKLPSIRSSP